MRSVSISILFLLLFVGAEAQVRRASPFHKFTGDCTPVDALSRWLFNSTLTDEEGVNTLTVGGAARSYYTADPKEGSASGNCNGAGYYYGVPQINYGNEFTVAFWFRKGTYSGYPGLYDAMATTNGFYLDIDTGGSRFRLWTNNGGTAVYSYSSAVTFVNNQWHHVALTINRTSGVVTIYFDGVDVTAYALCKTDFANNVTAQIGSTTYNAYAYFDDVQVYTRILSESEIYYLYNNVGGEVEDCL